MVVNDAGGATFRNSILAALPTTEIGLLRPHLSRVTLISGQVLHEPNSPIVDVFFVEAGVVSLSADTHDQGQVEVGLLGREGFVGASVMLSAEPWSVHRAFRSSCRRSLPYECGGATVCHRGKCELSPPVPPPR